MRICFVVSNLNTGAGWGRLASKMAESLKTASHTIGFILEDGKREDMTLILPLRFDYGNIFKAPVDLLKIRKFLSNFDIVLSFDTYPYGIFVFLACLGLNIKSVIYALGSYSLMGKSRIKNFLARQAFNNADEVFIVSEFLKKQIEKTGFKFKKYQMVPVGVDTDFFRPLAKIHSKFNFPFIISVGGLKFRKGYHISIPAFKIISEKYPDLKYLIIGNNLTSYTDSLKKLVKDLNLSEKVIFLEKVSDEDLLNYYNQALLFLLTPITTESALEGFGMVYLEASACSKPVIGTLNTGAEAAIVDGVTGFLVEGEPSQIAQAADRILSDNKLASDLGKNGLNRAQQFSWPNIAQIYLDSFRKLLETK